MNKQNIIHILDYFSNKTVTFEGIFYIVNNIENKNIITSNKVIKTISKDFKISIESTTILELSLNTLRKKLNRLIKIGILLLNSELSIFLKIMDYILGFLSIQLKWNSMLKIHFNI